MNISSREQRQNIYTPLVRQTSHRVHTIIYIGINKYKARCVTPTAGHETMSMDRDFEGIHECRGIGKIVLATIYLKQGDKTS